MPSPRDILAYMRTVGRGSPVDRPWSIAGQMLSNLRLGSSHAPEGSPLTLHDIMASPDYRNLMTAKVAEPVIAMFSGPLREVCVNASPRYCALMA